MKLIPIFLIVFGVIVILAPEILAYLIGGFFIFLGVNGLIFAGIFSRTPSQSKEEYVKFGKYKIYK